MVNAANQESPDIVEQLRDLGKYLKAEMEIRAPETLTSSTSRPREVVNVKITISNTFSGEPTGPRVVFLALRLKVDDTSNKHGSEQLPRWARDATRLHTKPQPEGGDGRLRPMAVVHEPRGHPSPDATSAERDLGEALFPGESLTCEMYVPPADLLASRFHVEWDISRRHLLHYQTPVPLPS